MSQRVFYRAHFPWNRHSPHAPQENRPYAEVIIRNGPRQVRLWCLVDSGADRLQLNRRIARMAGLNLAGATTRSMQTASGGTTTVDILDNVDLSIEGSRITDTCYFGDNTIPILGRVTFLNAFACGFDRNGWMRT